MTTRLLITGASGFIGRHCLPRVVNGAGEVHAVSASGRGIPTPGVTWHAVDLFDPAAVAALLGRVRPTHLLHLAWYVVPGRLAEAKENFDWVQASLELLRQFRGHGGQRVLMAGSAYEYDWTYGYCSELRTPRVPSTFYGLCKNALSDLLEGYGRRTGLSTAWARIFFLYGPHEHPDRLVPAVIRPLLRGEAARCSPGTQIRDYLHVEDVADALVRLLASEVTGSVNIGSGHPVALKDIVLEIGRRLGAEDLVRLGAIPGHPHDTPLVVADVGRLSRELQWQPRYGLADGLDHTIAWWKDRTT